MKSQSRLLLLERFTCIADQCPDNCCHGWDIPVDDTAYQQWQALEEGQIKQVLLDSISTIANGANTCHQLVQDEHKHCTHLSQEGLCYVQQQLGHAYLPKTCQEYPRVQVGSELLSTDSAYISCPEIARLVINEKNIETYFHNDKSSSPADNGLAKVIHSLDKLCNTLLPIHTVPAGTTLFYLSSVVLELMRTESGQPLASLLKKTANTTSKILAKRLKSLETTLNASKLPKVDQGEKLFWSFAIQLSQTDKLQAFNVLLKKNELDGLCAGENEATQHSAYQKLKNLIATQKRQPKLRKWVPSLRSYLIVKLRNHGFPHAPVQGNFLVNLLDCSVALATIQLWMWLLLKEQKTITENQLVTIIYQVERAFIHNDAFFRQLDANPQLLDMSAYLGCLADLG